MKLIFDLEADNLLDNASVIWCIVLRDVETGHVYRYGPDDIKDALSTMRDADWLIGHNVLCYDLPVLKKLHDFNYEGRVVDTLVMSRTIYPNLKERDFDRYQRNPDSLPAKLIGSHSLKAWGIRLGELKGDFNQGEDSFAVYTPEMLEYCVQDTVVTAKLYDLMAKKDFSEDALDLEHRMAYLLFQQELAGFPFDVESAMELYSTLLQEKLDIEQQLQDTFEPTIVELKTKTKTIPFNPASRQQIADRLMKRGWKPEQFSPTGVPKVDETILSNIDMPEAKLLNRYLLLNKRIGQLATGKQGWLKLEKEGKLHGRVNHMGAVTSRCTHSNPNIGQVPSVGAEYGVECRSLFHAPAGYKLLGADASGLELRCLAHYMARYDDGAYGREVLEGDIHTANQQAAGLPTRNNAKTFIYGFLYGAGDEKIGSIIGKGAKEGKSIKAKFLKKTPALKKLRDAVSRAAEDRGFIRGLDGRIIPIRHAHASLNTLLQSCGSLLCKRWYTFVHDAIQFHDIDATIVAFVHDEVQIVVREDQAEQLGELVVQAMKQTEQYYDFRCPLDAEYKVGQNWAETH